MGAEHANRLARLDEERFVVVQVLQGGQDLVCNQRHCSGR